MTWHVEQAHTPPQAWSSLILKPSEMSRMLPGRPLCPYGTFAGSTSTVLPLGRNVTLYFFVEGLYLTSSMYGFVPPMQFLPPLLEGLSEIKQRVLPSPVGQSVPRQVAGAQPCARARHAAPYKELSDFGEFPPFERLRDRAAHQQLRKVLGGLIQIINALADELVVAAGHGLFKRRHAFANPRTFFYAQARRLRVREGLGGRGQD